MAESTEFDKMVGSIAGAIFSDIAGQFSFPPLMLVPALTFKVRKMMDQITDVKLLSSDQMKELANDLQETIVPLLSSFDIDADTISKIKPLIWPAAYKALVQSSQTEIIAQRRN